MARLALGLVTTLLLPAAGLPERRQVAGIMVSVAASRVVRVAAQRVVKVAAQRAAKVGALPVARVAAVVCPISAPG